MDFQCFYKFFNYFIYFNTGIIFQHKKQASCPEFPNNSPIIVF